MATQPTVMVELLPGVPIFPPKIDESQEAALGDAVHAYLTTLPSMASLANEERLVVAERCLKGFKAETLLGAADLVGMGERLQEWVGARYPGAEWYTEVPVTAPRDGGGQWTGSVDLLLCLPGDDVVVIDHKSSPIRREHCANKAAAFSGQLAAYREVLGAQELVVREAWIHFPLAGAMVAMDAPLHMARPD